MADRALAMKTRNGGNGDVEGRPSLLAHTHQQREKHTLPLNSLDGSFSAPAALGFLKQGFPSLFPKLAFPSCSLPQQDRKPQRARNPLPRPQPSGPKHGAAGQKDRRTDPTSCKPLTPAQHFEEANARTLGGFSAPGKRRN